MNYVWVYIWPTIDAEVEQLTSLKSQIAPMTAGAGIEEVLVGGTVTLPDGDERTLVAGFHYQPGSGVVTSLGGPPTERLKPLDDYTQKVVRARRRGVVYPYELQAMIAGPGGTATSTTWTTAARSCRSTGRTASTRPASSPESSRRRPIAIQRV